MTTGCIQSRNSKNPKTTTPSLLGLELTIFEVVLAAGDLGRCEKVSSETYAGTSVEEMNRLGKTRFGIFTIATVVLLVLSSFSVLPVRNLLPEAHAANLTISLVANTAGWNYSQPPPINPTITVQYGDYLTFQLTASDSVKHRFYVDINNDTTPECVSLTDRCSLNFTMAASETYGFNAAFAPGTYSYYDMYYQSSEHGKFIVLGPGPDYALTASTPSLSIPRGGSKTAIIYVTSLNNFAGTISLAANTPSGLTATVNPTTVSVAANGASSSSLNVTVSNTGASGSYNLVVTGSNSSTFSHGVTVVVSVTSPGATNPDFTVSPSPTSLSLTPGGPVETVTITVASVYGFSGNVTLRDQSSGTGLTVSQNPLRVSIPSGGSQSSTLSVSAPASMSPGDYMITVAANSTVNGNPLAHSTTITLKVSSSSASSSPFLTTQLFIGVLAGLILLPLVVVLARRRSRSQ